MFKLRIFMHKMISFQIWCLLHVSKYLGQGHVYHGVASPSIQNSLKMFGLGLQDMLHAIFNAHLVSKAGTVISGNFHHVREIQVDNEPSCTQLFSE